MRKQMTAALAMAGLAPLAFAAPASAAASSGAIRYSFSDCFSDEAFEACFTVQGVFNVTETRSGNLHVVDNSRSTFTFASEEETSTGTSRDKFTLLLKKGQQQVVHRRSRFNNTVDGVTCSGSFRFLIVKGVVKKDRFNVSCDGELP